MKQFLLDQFCNYNKEVFENFNTEISKNLPIIGEITHDIVANPTSGIWGETDSNVWLVNSLGGKVFENNGIIHYVDFWKNEFQYKIITDLYELNNNEPFCLMPEPLIFEKHLLEIDDHSSGNPKGTEFYYSQFRMPNNLYGAPSSARFLWDRSTQRNLTFVNTISSLMLSLKKLGYPYCQLPTKQQCEDTWILIFDTPFNLTAEEYKSYFENQSNTFPDMKEYLRNICLQHLI
jgi:hypothetical protein